MHFDDGGVQFDGRDLDAHDLLALQLLEDAIQNAVLGPAIHACVNRVPVAETLGKSAPFAALLGDIENRVQHREIGQAHVAALTGKTGLDATILRLGNLYTRENTTQFYLVLTRPSCFLDSSEAVCGANAHGHWNCGRLFEL